MRNYLLSTFMVIFVVPLQAQEDSASIKSKTDLTFYVDTYYGYDFNKPYDNSRPWFLYQYNRNNTMSINMAMVSLSHEYGNLTANLGFNAGDFPANNMAHERPLLRTLYQANVSYLFCNKLQFTAGMFGSHMGFESALSFDNLLTGHSLASEWTPYYLAGAKLEYTPVDSWLIGLTVANGNQAITEYSGNNNKLVGLQVNWKPNENIVINYSNMYYNDAPDSASQFVFYSNLYTTMTFSNRCDFVVGFDYGINDNSVTNEVYDVMVASALARFKLNERFALAGRMEYYRDENATLISTPTGFAFETLAYSLNFDYSPNQKIKMRLEGRMFSAANAIFRDDTNYNPNVSPTAVVYSNQNANILLAVQAKF